MDITVHEGVEALEGLKPEWDALFQTCAKRRPFLMHEWLVASWRHFGGHGRLLTVCVREDGKVIGVVALREAWCPLGRQLTFAVDEADCRDFVIQQGAEFRVLEAFFRWLREEHMGWDLLKLRAVCARSMTGHLLPVVAEAAGLNYCAWFVSPCAYVRLPATRDEFYASMPGQLRRKKYAQALRRLVRERGQPVMSLLQGAEVTPEAVERFLELHRKSWAGRGGSASLQDERVPRFHHDLAAALAPTGVPAIFRMTVADSDAAAYYGFRMNGSYFAYMSAFDPDLKLYSIGGQATLGLIEHGIDHGWSEIDLMKGAERYKFDYTHFCGQTMDHCIAKSRTKLRLFTTMAALRGRFCQ